MTGSSDRDAHLDGVYSAKADVETSGYQEEPADSLAALDALGVTTADAVVDVGGGASRLVGALLERGHDDVTVLDMSRQALEHSRARLGRAGSTVGWVHHDVTTWRPSRTYAAWHDCAVFHLLTEADDREAYHGTLRATLQPGGALVVATFGEDGPEESSGLPVVRYSPDALAEELGDDVEIIGSRVSVHTTPSGTAQPFTWVWGRLVHGSAG
ncbi:class I SAM-dependent methyltransferase [Xylanimonas sp. McL0601]|uniref:class I SAM-dependent methyltransferase n=1 Tax=Xylanimonas sp. McL0601 TaxID=3414739 RepID=UPI003CEF55C2